MVTRFKFSLVFIIALYSSNIMAAILGTQEAEQADLTLLKDETLVFQSIGMGIALSLAQCEGIDLCSITVDEDEIKELINALDKRINSLVLKQEEAEDPVEFDKVLTAYVNERDNYATHLEKLKSITSTLDEDLDLLEKAVETEPDFPVESARDEELLQYMEELEFFEDEDLEDDESADEWSDLPDLEEEPGDETP